MSTILQVSSGKVAHSDIAGKDTAIIKHRIAGQATLTPAGIEGDEHAFAGHGTPGKAVLAMTVTGLRVLNAISASSYGYGQLGDNLMLSAFPDKTPGSFWHAGGCVMRVTGARTPCRVLSRMLGIQLKQLVLADAADLGLYLEVTTPGMLSEGMTVTAR